MRIEMVSEVAAPLDAVSAYFSRPASYVRTLPPDRAPRSSPLGARAQVSAGTATHPADRLLLRGEEKPWNLTMQLVPAGAGTRISQAFESTVAPFSEQECRTWLAFRALRASHDLARLSSRAGATPMRILIGGASGLVGSSLRAFLESGGHEVWQLVRGSARASDQKIAWSPDQQQIDAAALGGFDAVVHLGGSNIAAGRWTPQRKREIRESRVLSTRLLAQTLAKQARPPAVFVCASAVGYYGSRGAEWLTESSAPGDGFLPEIAKEWEAATQPAIDAGIRTVNLRIGVVLSPQGGALEKMLPPFRMGLGGVVGSGQQYLSWIGLDELVGVSHAVIRDDRFRGPINACTPEPVTNAEFTRVLGAVLNRPTIVPVPAFAIKLMFGEMGEATVLGSTRVRPEKLIEHGFAFRWSNLKDCLEWELSGRAPSQREPAP